MPRRPRPTSRRPPQDALPSKVETESRTSKRLPHAKSSRGSVASRAPPQLKGPFDDDESELGSDGSHATDDEDEDDEDSRADFDDSEASAEEEEEEVDVDAPRIAQWVDEEDVDGAYVDESETSSANDEEEGPEPATSLQSDLAALPFGALRKAQRALAKASAADGSDDEDEHASREGEDDDSGPDETTWSAGLKGKEREKGDAGKLKEIPKRKHKHAPVEMTSKRPVPRKKLEAEENKPVPRDPRFLPLAGEFSAQRFKSQYGFLADMHRDELKMLRENLKRARKLLVNSPRDLRPEREAEVERLERAVKRAESLVNKDKREKIEQDALSNLAQQEREKRKQGKNPWFMKESDKKDILLRAKYDALAAEGGKRAVKKAIEKKQKKVSQKEKKRRPFASGPSREDRSRNREAAASGKRPHSGFGGGEGDRPTKRPRTGPPRS
ncbi:DUF947-domain-containing protein [Obba rivulosa]|uniref:rRNA biogenesis protein RRP36 n=1 Tax=Obba rivulosa TaxID=1052685 RepID=A0A8E2B2J8_9APHY|nr:DUF947-domain-containing protein [Obba rivulosa]